MYVTLPSALFVNIKAYHDLIEVFNLDTIMNYSSAFYFISAKTHMPPMSYFTLRERIFEELMEINRIDIGPDQIQMVADYYEGLFIQFSEHLGIFFNQMGPSTFNYQQVTMDYVVFEVNHICS